MKQQCYCAVGCMGCDFEFWLQLRLAFHNICTKRQGAIVGCQHCYNISRHYAKSCVMCCGTHQHTCTSPATWLAPAAAVLCWCFRLLGLQNCKRTSGVRASHSYSTRKSLDQCILPNIQVMTASKCSLWVCQCNNVWILCSTCTDPGEVFVTCQSHKAIP